MGKKSLIKYIHSGELAKGLSEAEQSSPIVDPEEKIFFALLLVYKGNFENAIKILKVNFREKHSLNDKINLYNSLVLIDLYFNTKRPIRDIEDLYSYITFLIEQLDIKELNNFWKGKWLLVQGKRHEANGKLIDAINSFLEAVNYLQKQENKFELMELYFQIAVTSRKYGDLMRAVQYTELALKLASRLDYQKKAFYLTYLAEIHLIQSHYSYSKAKDILESALKIWNQENIVYGIEWATLNLGFVNHLESNLKKAFNCYKEVYDLKKGESEVRFKIKIILVLMELLIELNRFDEAASYISELQSLINFDLFYEDILHIAERMIIRNNQGFNYKIFNDRIFPDLKQKDKSIYEKKIQILLNQLELFLVELHFAKSDEAMKISKGTITNFLDVADSTLNLIVQSTILIDEFTNLAESNEIDEPFIIPQVEGVLPIFHSLPILTMFLYMLARRGVTLEELHKAVEIRGKWIYEYTEKLEKNDFLYSEKKIFNEKEQTVYFITEIGLNQFENYIKSVIDFFSQYLFDGK